MPIFDIEIYADYTYHSHFAKMSVFFPALPLASLSNIFALGYNFLIDTSGYDIISTIDFKFSRCR
jgi:hypothetical protein